MKLTFGNRPTSADWLVVGNIMRSAMNHTRMQILLTRQIDPARLPPHLDQVEWAEVDPEWQTQEMTPEQLDEYEQACPGIRRIMERMARSEMRHRLWKERMATGTPLVQLWGTVEHWCTRCTAWVARLFGR